jgi:hypothetical protein
MLNRSLMFKSPLPKWDMICEFMHNKFDSSIQE